jgi:DNA replication protein DnaC
MTYFLKQGNTYRVSKKEALDIQEKLPVGNYIIKKDEMSGQLFLEQIEPFEFSGKVYGDTMKRAQRILHSFNDRPASTGVMLAGEKGSGKTLLAKMLSIKGYDQGVPTIVINQPWCGEAFNAFIQKSLRRRRPEPHAYTT